MTHHIIVIGPPASGKGTHGQRLSVDLGLDHVATGDLLRTHVAERDELGEAAEDYMSQGQLVPDELVVRMLSERLADTAGGVVLDGFPRTVAQADALADQVGLGPTLVIVLEVPEQVLVERIAGRRVCPNGHVYHVSADPSEQPGVCDIDGEPLEQRPDDTPETIRERLSVYRDQTEPLVDRYARQGLVSRVDGVGEPEDVYARVRQAVLG
ncbi:MAG TPA: adenylate kinase [Nitriliruptorales bacterium]